MQNAHPKTAERIAEEHGKSGNPTGKPKPQGAQNAHPAKTSERIAEEHGVGERTYDAGKLVLDAVALAALAAGDEPG